MLQSYNHAYQQDYFQAFSFFFSISFDDMKNAKIVLLCKREAKQASSIACCPKLLFPIRCQVVPHLFSKKAMNHYNLACHLSLKICKVSPTLKHIIGFASLFLVKLKLSTIKYRKTVAFSRFFFNQRIFTTFLVEFPRIFQPKNFHHFSRQIGVDNRQILQNRCIFTNFFTQRILHINATKYQQNLSLYVAGFKPFLLCTS